MKDTTPKFLIFASILTLLLSIIQPVKAEVVRPILDDAVKYCSPFKDVSIEKCISMQYRRLLVIDTIPWLKLYNNQILPNYPVDLVIAGMVYQGDETKLGVIDCIITKNPRSIECDYSSTFRLLLSPDPLFDLDGSVSRQYGCSHPDSYSNQCSKSDKVVKAFIDWFLSLDKPKRNELMSFLGDEDSQLQKRASINSEAREASRQYQQEIETKQTEKKKQMIREVLGN